jgi:hypothetical protein
MANPKHHFIYTIAVHLAGPSADSAISALTYSAVKLADAAGDVDADITKTDDIAARCDHAFELFWPQFAASDWTYKGLTVTTWNGAGAAVDAVTLERTVTPPTSATMMPPGIAFLARKIVPRPVGTRRAPKGHFFVPSVGEAAIDNTGRIAPAGVLVLDALLNGWRTDHAASDLRGIPVSMQLEFKAGKAATVLSRAPISSLNVDNKITYLRKRGR